MLWVCLGIFVVLVAALAFAADRYGQRRKQEAKPEPARRHLNTGEQSVVTHDTAKGFGNYNTAENPAVTVQRPADATQEIPLPVMPSAHTGATRAAIPSPSDETETVFPTSYRPFLPPPRTDTVQAEAIDMSKYWGK